MFTRPGWGRQGFLSRPMELNVWRAPVDNDRKQKQDWLAAHYDKSVTRCYRTEWQWEEGAVFPDGAVDLRLFLPGELDQAEYCGLGPWESYPDKRRAASYGVYALLSSFVMIFLINTVGPSSGILGALIAASKLFDGVTDILFGAMIDKTHTRMGKARPWMLWGYVGCAETLAAIF